MATTMLILVMVIPGVIMATVRKVKTHEDGGSDEATLPSLTPLLHKLSLPGPISSDKTRHSACFTSGSNMLLFNKAS